jgi:polyhydroxyalkanoate synthesis regulator phasin
MDVKKAAMDQLMKLMQNPKVMQVAMNPKVMSAVMTAMSVRGKVASASSTAVQTVARSLNLATRDEVKELRRTIRRLEETIGEMEAREQDAIGGELDDDEE